jgi:siderophore synthetase component
MQGTAYSYQHPPEALSLESTSIEWEQSIVEGHPTHPVRCGSTTC